MLHLFGAKAAGLFSIQTPPSATGTYLVEICGTNVCIVASNVLCKNAFATAYSESVLTLHQVSRSATSFHVESLDLQHLDPHQPAILGLSYHPQAIASISTAKDRLNAGASTLRINITSAALRWQPIVMPTFLSVPMRMDVSM